MSRAAHLSVGVTTVVALGALPLLAIAVIFQNVVHGGLVTDFENVFYVAATDIVGGESPYPRVDDEIVALG
jgi:hypothetical protein